MAAIGILAEDPRVREELRLIIEELGHRAVPSKDLRNALESLATENPKLMLVAQSEMENLSESLLAELEREAPLLPVITAMRERRAARAMELMRSGVFEAVAPPWTAETFSPCLSKALRYRGTALEVVHVREETKGVFHYFLLALIALGLAVGYSSFGKRARLAEVARRAVPVTQWTLPYSHPAGMAYDGKHLWVADWFSKSIYLHDPKDLRVIRQFTFPSELPGAIAFAGDALWISASSSRLVKHMLDDRLKVLGNLPDHGGQSIALAYDGLYLWTCDRKSGRLHKRILDADLSTAASFDYPGGRAAALTFDGRTLWSLDAAHHEILRHDLDNPSRITFRLPIPEYRSGAWKPTGLAWNGTGFWTVAESLPKGEVQARVFFHPLPESARSR